MRRSDLNEDAQRIYDQYMAQYAQREAERQQRNSQESENSGTGTPYSDYVRQHRMTAYNQLMDGFKRARESGALKTSKTRNTLATIGTMNDRKKANEIYGMLSRARADKKSEYYDPYSSSTHTSVERLRRRGYDVDKIDDDWFEQNKGLKDFLTLNDYTNSVKKPGKRASDEEKDAYDYYQLKKNEDKTKKAEKETEELRQYLTGEATRADRTLSDREIIEGIDWKKFPTLAKMREYADNGAPMSLNRAVNGASEDWAYGVLWSAMNGGGSGDDETDQINATLGCGRTWLRDVKGKKEQQESEARALRQTTKNQPEDWRRLTQDATYMFGGQGNPGLAYQAKMQYDSIPNAAKLAYGPALDAEHTRNQMNDYVTQEEQRQLDANHEYNEKMEELRAQQLANNKGSLDSFNEWIKLQNNGNEKAESGYDINDPFSRINIADVVGFQTQRDWTDDTSGDVTRWSDEKLQNEILKTEEEIRQRDEHPLTDEEIKEKNQRLWDINQMSIYTYLDLNGLTDNVNGYGDVYRGKPDDYETYSEEYNDLLYDAIHGKGSYQQRVFDLQTDEEADQLDAEMEDLWSRLENQTLHELDEAKQKEAEKKAEIEQLNSDLYFDRQKKSDYLAKLRADEERRNRKKETEELAKGAENIDPEYDPSLIPEPRRYFTEESGMDYDYEPQGTKAEKAYFWINNPQILDGMENTLSYARKEYFLTPEMKETFNTLFKQDKLNGTDNATAFLEGIDPYLSSSLLEYRELTSRKQANIPVLGAAIGAFTLPMKLVSGAMSTIGTMAGILGNEAGQDPTSGFYLFEDWVNNYRDERGEKYDKWAVDTFGEWAKGKGKFLNGVVYSIGDNLFAMAAAGANSGNLEKSEKLVQLIMSSEATGSIMLEQLKEEKDPTEAALMALGGGVIEALTEKYSLEALLKPDFKELLGKPKDIAKFLLKNIGAEASEEGASDMLNMALDAVLSTCYGHENELQKQYDELVLGGMAENDAMMTVLINKFKETGLSMLAGGLSGGLMAGGRVISNISYEQVMGKNISKNQDAGGANALVGAAMELDEGSASRKAAEALQAKIDAGKKVSNYELGKLAQNIYTETDEQIGKATQSVIEDQAFDRLADSGLDEAGRREMAQILSEAVVNGGLDNIDKEKARRLSGNKAAFNLYASFIFAGDTNAEVTGAVMDRIRKESGVRDSVSELLGAKKTAEVSTEDVGEQMATDEEIAEADAKGRKRSGSSADVIVGGEYGTVTGIRTVTEGDGENRRTRTVYTVDMNGETRTVDLSDIRTLDFGTAAILRHANANQGLYATSQNQTQTDGKNNFEQYTDILLKAQAEGKAGNAGTFLANAQRIRMAAFTGQAMPVVNMDRETAMEIYRNSALEHKANRESMDQTGGRNARQPGAGVVRFGNAEYGTEGWNKALGGIRDEKVRNQMNAAAEIARSAGADITFYTAEDAAKHLGISEKDQYGYYGWENAGGIGINIEGKNFNYKGEATGSHHILVTFGHELTHWMQRNSLKGYNRLEQFVAGELVRTRGEAYLNRRLEQIMDRQGLNLEDAMSELVADSCDQILANESVQKHIAETNEGLFKEIRGFVKDLVARVKAAVKGMGESMSWDSLMMVNSVNRLAKVWLGAYDEALSGVAGAAETAAADTAARLSYNTMKDLSWEEQVNRILSGNANKNDLLVINDMEDLKAIGLDRPITIRQAVLTKGMRIRQEGRSKSAHNLTRTNVLNLKEELLHPVARIENGENQYIITDLLDIERNHIVLIANPLKDFTKGGVYDAKTVGGRTSITTLFGTYEKETGKFIADKNAKIFQYKENANGILSIGPRQFGARQDVFDAIDRLSQDTGGVKFSRNVDTSNWKTYSVRDGVMYAQDSFGETVLEGVEREYVEAWQRGDYNRMEEILADKIRENGAIPFKTPREYTPGDIQRIANEIKEGKEEAINQAAKEMAELVPENAVLVPMPNHYGEVNEDTDTMLLAKAISEITGRPVVTALAGTERESRREDKNRPKKKQMKAADLGIRQVAEIPDGTVPYIVDNMIAAGTTAEAAHRALGNNGVTIAYAKGLRSANAGLKRANVTFYDKPGSARTGKWLIPLGERIDLGKTGYAGTKFSKSETAIAQEKYKGKSLHSDESLYDYDFLVSMPDIKIITSSNRSAFAKKNGFDYDMLEKQAMENARENGRQLEGDRGVAVKNVYTGREVVVTHEGALHSTHYNNQTVNIMNAKASEKIGELVKYGIPINALNEKGIDVKGSYALAAPMLSEDGKKKSVAVITVDERTGKVLNAETYDQLHSASIRKKNEVGFETTKVSPPAAPETGHHRTTRSTMTISEFLEDVNSTHKGLLSQNVLDRLGETKPTGYWADRAKFSRAQLDNEYMQAVKDGNQLQQERFSRVTAEGMDVGAWMSAQTPGTLMTEDERALLQSYKDLRISISLAIKRQLDYKAKIKALEEREADLTAAERDDLASLRSKLDIQQQRQADLEDKLYQVTSSEGYAGMMRQNNIVLKDFILGKTQDQVRESVEQMVDQVKAAEKMIASQVKALRKLAESQAVKAVSSMINRKTLNFAVKSLKSEFNTSMGKTELESRLTEMALKRANGEDIVEDARALAIDMTNEQRGYQMDVLERMRGLTIVIGPDQRAEMKGNGMTLGSVREQLRGTGVRVKYGDYSSLDTDTVEGGELRTLLPELPADIGENSADALFSFISWAQNMRDTDQAVKQSMVDIDEVMPVVHAMVSTIEVKLNTPEYRKQNEAAAKTREMADTLEETGKQMSGRVGEAGTKAVGWASVLQRDVHTAIDYYNRIAKMAAQEEKNKVRKSLIEQLQSENTIKLIKQQRKYEEMMRNDRKARELAEDNRIIRGRINEVAKRVRKRLMEETDQKNIPEAAKPLARMMLEMLVKHDYVGYRHVLFSDRKQLERTMKALDSYSNRDGKFDAEEDLKWLVVGTGEDADTEMRDRAIADLIDIEQGLMEYRTAEGHRNITLMDRREALKKVQHAVSEIWSMIDARSNSELNGRRMLVAEIADQVKNDMKNSRHRGELTGKLGHAVAAVKGFAVSGNMTPEYFFKNLRNGTLSQLYEEYHRAENRNGLEVGKAQRRIAEIAEKYGYKNWDPKKRYSFKLEKGGEVSLTLGEMMSLYATWEREAMNQAELNGPEESFHLKTGGFYTAQEEKAKVLGREIVRQKAHRLTEADMAAITDQLTPEQIGYVRDMVEFMTKDIGELGNEASMRMYGIRKYKEKWYFPFEIWDGVKSKKSGAGAAGNTENRIAHSSFSKRRVSNASNALVIRDFTETAVKHIGQMINYNTFAPAIEFMNRVMNEQVVESENGNTEGATRRNLRAMFAEMYGKDAMNYFDNFQQDVNGGVTRPDTTIADKLLSTFKKSAVAGSMSVALQQPLSYIRAAMMINPKYLAAAINPAYFRGSKAEMEKYSGVAVIKSMGKFDMNFGQSAQDYMMPEGMQGKAQAAYQWVSDKSTALPELMDAMTWTRMWTACKLEQKALHPEMDTGSDEFLNKVAERFNDVMRKTQVYDSVLVKSRNMRSTHWWMKGITSFMAEPTLTANVLADAVANVKEKGGKGRVAKAGATFMLSAVLQALVKGLMGAGRNPQDKKTWDENVAYRFASSFLGEVNPLGLIPGYSDLMEVLINGELKDDAMGVVGKVLDAVETGAKWIRGEKGDTYRYIEDSAGQLAQLFTNVPAKNIMRDARAMWNFIVARPYADRENSEAVLKYQLLDLMHNTQNLTGFVNQRILADKGWQTQNGAYYDRIWKAKRAGNEGKAAELSEYLTLGRGVKEKTIKTQISSRAKDDESMTDAEKAGWLIDENGGKSGGSYTLEKLKKGKISAEEAMDLLKKAYPDKPEDDIWWQVDRIRYELETGTEVGSGSKYYRLKDAIGENRANGIREAVEQMKKHGLTEKGIRSWISKEYKQEYLKAMGSDKIRMKDALTKALKAAGMAEADAVKLINGWKEKKA